MNRDGSATADQPPEYRRHANVAPTGAQLAFVSDRTGTPQIYIIVMPPTGLQVIRGSRRRPTTWSPAPLNEIAFSSALRRQHHQGLRLRRAARGR